MRGGNVWHRMSNHRHDGTLYWKGTGSETLDESDLSGNALEEYIFFNDQRIARRDVSTNVMHSTSATIWAHMAW
jgi:hypothetical protein